MQNLGTVTVLVNVFVQPRMFPLPESISFSNRPDARVGSQAKQEVADAAEADRSCSDSTGGAATQVAEVASCWNEQGQ